MQTAGKLILAVFLFLIIGRFCHKMTDGFKTANIYSDVSHAAWNTPPPTERELSELQAIFSQPFYYLGSGGQCYAFASQDGKAVLKLFKMHHFRQYPLLYRLSLPGCLDQFRVKFLLSQKEKLERVFSSSHLAYTALKNETGLLYLNINSQEAFKKIHAKVVDKIGIEHTLDLSSAPFALQFRADNPFQALRLHLRHKDVIGAKAVVKEIVDCLKARYLKGIQDLDPALRRNVGLIKDRAIAIDIGSFYVSKALSAEEMQCQLVDDTNRMRRWLLKRSPELTAYLDELTTDFGCQ